MASQVRTYPIVKDAINLFGSWLKHRQEIRELRGINSGDLARIAQDLSVTAADLDSLVCQGPHASDELPRLLKSLGIDQATLSRMQPLPQRDMMRVCSACQQKTRCDHDLDAGTSAQHYEEYCLNAPSIDGLDREIMPGSSPSGDEQSAK